MLDPKLKVAIYMEEAVTGPSGKMGFGVLRYSENPILCVIDSLTAGQSISAITGIPVNCPIVPTVDESVKMGAQVLILGIAPVGGLIPPPWWDVIDKAVNAGLSIVNGLHDLVASRYPKISTDPSSGSQFIWDVRIEPNGLANGTGAAMSLTNRRVLLIGTDMAVGKMTAGLEMYRVAKEKGIKTGFVATGQIGITVTGAGIPLDAIRVDYASGAVEREVLDRSQKGAELVIVEGQGTLIHPGSTANLPLLRGSCPTHMILCHKSNHPSLRHLPQFKIPDLAAIIRLYEDLSSACGTFSSAKTVGVAMNTAGRTEDEARKDMAEIEDHLNLPCVDPIRNGPERLVHAVMA